MAGDYRIALCADCEFRPVDPDTGKKVEGGLRLAQRNLGGYSVAVVYSEVDPRINAQYRLDTAVDRSKLVREANNCIPIVERLPAGLVGDTESRIKQARKNAKVKICPLVNSVSVDVLLPSGLLYKTELA